MEKQKTPKPLKKLTLIETGLFILVMVLIFTPTPSHAKRPKVNFTGKWVLDESRSKLGEFKMAADTLVNLQTKDSLIIERKGIGFNDEEYAFKEKVGLDGNECTNMVFGRSKKISKAVWTKDRKSLVVKSILYVEWQGEQMEISTKEIYNLGDDKKILIIHTTSSSEWGDRENKYIYDLKE